MKTKLLLPCFLFAAFIATGLHAQTNFQFNLPIAKGPFTGKMESLTNYSYPEWFRDA